MPDVKVKDPRDIQAAHEDHFNGVKQAEQSPGQSYIDAGTDQAEAFANDPANAIRDQEESGAGSDANWQVNRDASAAADKTPQKAGGFKAMIPKIAKRGSMPVAILSVILGGGGILSFFSGGATLIVNLAEVMTKKFDYQVSSMEVRNRAIIKTKLAGVDGCTTLSFKCKYSTFSDKELANMKKQGIEPTASEKTITGRNKVTALKYNGEEINAKSFADKLKTNPAFANAMHGAYNMKFLSKWDSIWDKIEKKFKISKKAPFDENMTDEERAKKVKEDVKNGAEKTKVGVDSKCEPDKCTDDQKKQAAEDEANKTRADALTEAGGGENSNASGVLDEIKSGGGAGAIGLNMLKITGAVDSACMVAGWVNVISATAKTVRLAQMIRYGMIFLTTASMIKAGTATPEDVAYLGTILTMVVKSNSGNLSKSATDSFGYRFAAFGDSGIDNAGSLAVAGGSFGGTIEQAVSKIYTFIPGGKKGAKTACGFLSNPFVQAGSILAGIGGLFFGVTEAKAIAQAVLVAAIAFAAPFLAAYLGELLAGELIKSTTFGEESGNIITSASGGLLSQAANFGGGSVLHKDQATAFLQTHNEVASSYAAYDRSVLSPFDASSPNTFLGSMFTQFAPYLYSNSSPMATVRNLSSIVMGSAKNLVSPSVSADAANVNECGDPQYEELDIAADPFCNPIVGIPPQYMGADPIAVQDTMKGQNLVDEEGNPIAGGSVGDSGLSYPDFIAQCMQREQPYGLGDLDSDKSDKCFIDSQDKANAYVHAVDLRVGGVSDTDSKTGATGTELTGTDSSTVNSSAASTDQLPAYCTASLAATDFAQIACKSYQYNEYGYQWGGGHDGTAAGFLEKFKAGGFAKGTQILDCSGLVRMAIFEVTGVDIGGLSTGDFPSSPNLQSVPKDQAKPGDIVWYPGHTEIIVSNDAGAQMFYTFGAHTDGIAIDKQIGPSSYAYSKIQQVFRVKK